MVKFYAISLVLGILGLLVVILGGTLMENLGRPEKDPGITVGMTGRMVVGGLTGFGMAGMSAEFAPLDFTWPVALILALAGGAASVLWVRYASKNAGDDQ